MASPSNTENTKDATITNVATDIVVGEDAATPSTRTTPVSSALVVVPNPVSPMPPTDEAVPSTGVLSTTVLAPSTSNGNKGKGRRKILMKKMEKESNLLVTFSKRRAGLFKKASELCTLCGVRCAFIVFSPAGKAYSFGQPSVESVLERYHLGYPNVLALGHNEALQNVVDAQLNADLDEITAAVNNELKLGEIWDQRRKMRIMASSWPLERLPLEQLNRGQLGQLESAMIGLKERVTHQASRVVLATTASSSAGMGQYTVLLADMHGADHRFGFGLNNNALCINLGGGSNSTESDDAGPSDHAPGSFYKGSGGGRDGSRMEGL